ncbi:MAG: hypothetical protein ACERKN_04420 [Velocimicrobium sp.]
MNLFESVSGSKQMKNYFLLLDEYKKTLDKYQKKIETFGVSEEDKMAAVQVALDLTYLKEELDEIKPKQDQLAVEMDSLHQMMKEISLLQKQIEEKFAQIDKVIIEPIMENYSSNRIEIIDKFDQVMEYTKKKSKMMLFSLILNVVSIGGVVFIMLYLMDIIRF